MDFVEQYKIQILVAGLTGAFLGFVVNLRWGWFVLMLLSGSGFFALGITGDWCDFFKDGFSIGHMFYLPGYYIISVLCFGPFGVLFGVLTRVVKIRLAKRLKTGHGLPIGGAE